ncbi:MAG TPA: hypothetical protein VKT72_13365 [Candidatus Baltobacteraceae bacterium]|nr:hypothetical protein [Candidatus Baltobacteraceae bacterium]
MAFLFLIAALWVGTWGTAPVRANKTTRLAVNGFIRHSGTFDAVADFDAAVRDPHDSHRILPAFDSGDHLHPNGAGHRAMANAVDLGDF